MRKLLLIEMNRMLRSKMMWFSLGIGMLIAFAAFLSGPLPASRDITRGFNGGVNNTIRTVFNSWLFSLNYWVFPIRKLYVMIMPLLAAFAYSTSLVKDQTSGYVKNIFIKSAKRDFYISKCLVAHFAGGMVVIIPMIFNLMLTSMILPSVKPEAVLGFYEPGGFEFLSSVAYSHPYLYILLYLIIIFLYCGIFTTCALLIAQFVPIPFIAGLFPFVFNYFVGRVMGFFHLSKYNPINIMTIGYGRNNSLTAVLLEWLFIEMFFVIFYMWKGVRSETF